MFKWLRECFRKWWENDKNTNVRPTGFVIDSWERALYNGYYVAEFREQLDNAAVALGPHTTNEFNPSLGCADLRNDAGLIACVRVNRGNGECKAVIESYESLPEQTKEVLRNAVRPLKVTFKTNVEGP